MPSRKPRPVSGRRKPPADPYKSKIVKPESQQSRDRRLTHAVTHKDKKAIEDYDEWDWENS
jgi:hypothetical protein